MTLFLESSELTYLVDEDEIIGPAPDILLDTGQAHVKGNSLDMGKKQGTKHLA